LKRGRQIGMTKKELVEKIEELLGADADLGFLLQLGGKELETLVASIRERIDRVGQ
jgi:ribosomal protein L29